jgi:predicted transcriptional regulator
LDRYGFFPDKRNSFPEQQKFLSEHLRTKGERDKMLTVNIPDNLTSRIHDIAKSFCQTAEEFIIETLQDRIDHASAYSETEYLAQSATNKERLNRAVKDIQSGKYEAHELLND